MRQSMIYIMFGLFFCACQPADDTQDDTDTTPDCAENETAVVTWCFEAENTIRAYWCELCGDPYSCENPDASKDSYRIICDDVEILFGDVRECVDKTSADHCLASLLADGCDEDTWTWFDECESLAQ